MIAVYFALLNLAEGALIAAWHHHHRLAAGLALATVGALRWTVARIPSERLHELCAPTKGRHTRAHFAAHPIAEQALEVQAA